MANSRLLADCHHRTMSDDRKPPSADSAPAAAEPPGAGARNPREAGQPDLAAAVDDRRRDPEFRPHLRRIVSEDDELLRRLAR